MDFRNCIECGSLFRFVSRNICPECIALEEKEFKAVYDYVRTKKQVSIDEVSEATGVSSKKILRFLRDERLSASEIDSQGYLNCSRCGKPINSGSYCDNCSVELTRQIIGNSPQQKGAENIDNSGRSQMYTAKLPRKTV